MNQRQIDALIGQSNHLKCHTREPSVIETLSFRQVNGFSKGLSPSTVIIIQVG